jgi:hypothetical protein
MVRIFFAPASLTVGQVGSDHHAEHNHDTIPMHGDINMKAEYIKRAYMKGFSIWHYVLLGQ